MSGILSTHVDQLSFLNRKRNETTTTEAIGSNFFILQMLGEFDKLSHSHDDDDDDDDDHHHHHHHHQHHHDDPTLSRMEFECLQTCHHQHLRLGQRRFFGHDRNTAITTFGIHGT